jgi:hypothetical protein
MMDNIDPEIDLVAAAGIILEVFLEVQILDKRGHTDIVIARIDLDIVVVFAVDERGVRKKPAIEKMIPAQGGGSIAIVDAKGISETQLVLAQIGREKDTIIFSQLVIAFQIDIVEIQTVLIGGGVL